MSTKASRIRMKYPGYSLEIETEPYDGLPSMTLPFRSIQDDCPMLMMPREILEMIFAPLDGLTLARLSSTCVFLYNFVNEVAQWERLLLHDEVKKYHLIDLGLNFCTPLWRVPLTLSCSRERLHALRALHYPWKHMYYSTQMWHSKREWNFELLCIGHVTMDEITSIKVAGQDVLFGTVKGGLGLWNPDKYGTTLKPMNRFPAEVDEILVQIQPDKHNVQNNYRIIVHCIDTNMIVYDMEEFALSGGRLQLRNFKRISSHKENLYEWDPESGAFCCTVVEHDFIRRCSSPPSHSWISLLPRGVRDILQNGGLPYGPFVAVNIFESLFISRDRGPLLIECDPQTLRYKVEQLAKAEHSLGINKAYIWPEQISLSITASGFTVISIGRNSNFIHWPPAFKGVSAHLLANVLIIGTNVGQVLFYNFKHPTDLIRLKAQDYHQILNIGVPESIIYVGVRVQNCLHNFPDIIAATRSKIYCFRASGFL